MKFIFTKDYDCISPLIDGPYNAPIQDEKYTESYFENEYNGVRNALIEILHSYCLTNNICPDLIDVGHRTGPTRGIGLVMDERAKSHTAPLIDVIQNFL